MNRRRRLRAWAGIALAVALGAFAAPAGAIPLQEPILELSFRLDVPGALPCVIFPREARTAEGCQGIDVAAIEQALQRAGAVPASVAHVRLNDWSFVVSVLTAPNMRPWTAEDISEYVAGLAQGAAERGARARIHGERPGTPYDLLKVNKVDVIRAQMDMDIPAGHPRYRGSCILWYTFVGRHGTASISFATDPEHIGRLRPIAEQIARTGRMPPADLDHFGAPESYVLGTYLGRATGIVIAYGVLGVLVILFLAALQRRRLRGATPPAPPSP